MTHQAILTKAIEKAIEGRWDKFGNPKHNYRLNEFTNTQGNKDIEFKLVRGTNDVCYYTINDIIYSHDFARALWGDIIKKIVIDDYDLSEKPQPLLGGLVEYPYSEGAEVTFKTILWQYHLQMMIVADDPIAYLGDNLPA